MEQKHEFILLYKSGRYTITNLADMFGIAQKTVDKYIEHWKYPKEQYVRRVPTHGVVRSGKANWLFVGIALASNEDWL